MTTNRAERRTGWALPPLPPENWVGSRWSVALAVAVVTAVAVPAIAVRHDRTATLLSWALLSAVVGAGALLTAYVLLIQASVTGDVRLRWMAAGYTAIWPLALLRIWTVGWPGEQVPEVERGAALGLLLAATVPVMALLWPHVRRGVTAAAIPLALLATGVVAVLLLPDLPELVTDAQSRTGALRATWIVVGLVAAAATLRWHFTAPFGVGSTWSWVSAGLALTALAGFVLGSALSRYDEVWWAGQLLLALAFVVPAAGLSLVSAAGYRRQSRRWRQLVTEVAGLRAASPLLPGLSVSPEDEEGLPTERDVRALIGAGIVKVALQPVVRLDDSTVVGFEALSRFGGRVPTDRWFRAASRYHLVSELERLTLHSALALLPGLPPEVFLAVNVSPAALEDPEVLDLLHAIDLSRVVVEVTEHEAVGDYPVTRATLDGLRRAGARIAVDDTGAGFASLRHVLMLQPDVVKLDTSLSRAVHHDVRQRELVTALLTFAREVGSIVIAEGIETEEQLDALRDLGVPLGQGWHLGVPAVVS